MSNWIDNGYNKILKGDGFRISYLSGPESMPLKLDAFNPDDNKDETALILETGEDQNFYILNGDFRKEYEELVDQGFDACYKFFEANADKKSSWSE